MADYTFYTHPMSRGQIARWALHETAADYDTVIVEYGPRSPEFLAINPMGKVPTLVHHLGGRDHTVTEAAAICHYLAETQPDANLLPEIFERADYYRWMFFAAGPLEQAVTSQSMGWEVPPEREVMAGFGNFERAVGALSEWFAGHDYVCGSRFTMADVYVGSQVDWGLAFKTIPATPALEAYAARLRERAAYQAAKTIDNALIAEREAQQG